MNLPNIVNPIARPARGRGLARLLIAGLLVALAGASPAVAAVLAGWDVHALAGGANSFGASPLAATVSDVNLSVGGLTRGSGVSTTGTAAARAWGGVDWQNTSAASAVSGNDVVSVTLTANSGYNVSISSLSRLDYRRSSTGPSTGVLQYQIGSGAFTDIGTLAYTVTASSGGSLGPIDLSGVAALQHVPAGTTVTFRIVNYGGSSSTGTWYVFDTANTTANDLEIQGSVAVGSGTVDGACGSANGQTFATAPGANLCAAGSASALSGNGPWAWSCAGTGGGVTASCSANKSAGGPFTIFHMNDVHARLTPHKWVINQHGSAPDVFEDVGGAAYLAGKLLSLTNGKPTALVLDGGDISEGNPVGDMNGNNATGYGNGGITAFYELLHGKLKAVAGRGGRGIDALVVGNHDVRDASYITNMEHMRGTGVPVISANVRDIATHTPHFPAFTTVTVNGTKVGIIGYTTPSAQVGASLSATLEVVQCDWTGTAACHIADYVNELRTNQGCDVVILLTHDGHSNLVDPTTPVLADTSSPRVPEIAVTGHWHTWAETVWQPAQLNYKTIFTESASYMKYIGELNVNAAGGYVSAVQHVLRNADITPDPDVQAFVSNLITTYNAAHPGHPVDEVVGYTDSDLRLDNAMKWWSADEYPWNGNNTAGQWITDAMKWKCDQIWSGNGGCDLAVEAGGGVRADIPAGAVTWRQVYETFPWADDTYYRINMTGQDIINFLKATNLDAGFSRALDVTAFDGIPTSVKVNGTPIGLSTVYKVAINNYMFAHPPAGYTWTDTAPLTSPELVRESLADFMRAQHASAAAAYSTGGDRYHFNGEYSGGFRAVVTMMNDNESKPTFEDAFIRLLSANAETLARRGSKQVPADLVNADGTVVATNRLAEQELYRSFLGFKAGALQPGDIIEVWGKASFFGGNPEFVDQEGVYGDGVEFKVLGHDASLAKPTYVSSIGALLSDDYKNHYVRFLARKTAASMVADQFGQLLKVWDKTGYTAATLPGNVGDTLSITGVLTMENFGFRLRSDAAVLSASALPGASGLGSRVAALPVSVSAPVTLSAATTLGGGMYMISPSADAQVASGNAATNYGTGTNLYVQSSSTSSFGNERTWLKFDLSGIPAGATITGAKLQLWNWKSAGASLPVEVRGATDDSWGETAISWNNQPAPGAVLDTQTLLAGTTDVWYGWNVGSFVQQQFGADKTVSLMLKAATEGAADATAPSYAFDAREYGSNMPTLQVSTQSGGTAIGNVKFFYRYSADNVSWGAWTQAGATDTVAPYSVGFSFPDGYGYYEFYSVATDNLGNVEATPDAAQASVHYAAPSGSAQSISFPVPASLPAASSLTLSASSTSGLPVGFASLTTDRCTVSGNVVTTIAVGTCTLTATQSGDAGYWLAASVTQSITVAGLSQRISFAALPAHVLGDGPVALTASASSGLTVEFASLTTTVCTVLGNSVTLLAAGRCTISASQPGDSAYAAAATVTQGFDVTTGAIASTDGDVPIPAWALGLLGLAVMRSVRQRAGR